MTAHHIDREQIYVPGGGSYVILTLNRPERRNALTMAMQERLAELLWEADEMSSVHAVVLAGRGEHFCAGYDLSERWNRPDAQFRGMRELDDDIWHMTRHQRWRMAIFDMHKPVIAEVQGACVAGGTDLALMTDMVIAAKTAQFGFPPVRDLGSPPNNLWLYHLGPQWSKRLLLTGDRLNGEDAAQLGLVLKAVPEDMLRAEVTRLAERLCLIDPHLLAINKRSVNLGLEMMGARTMQRLAVEADARAHRTPAAEETRRRLRGDGPALAFKARDGRFTDNRASIGPEVA